MKNYYNLPFCRPEQIEDSCLTATYIVNKTGYADILSRVGAFAVGQTIGTWVKVPGISQAMVNNYQGRIVSIVDIPSEESDGDITFVIRIAFPIVNFGGSIAMMMTALVGNDVSTSMDVKLVSLEFDGKAQKDFVGPLKSINDLRDMTGAYDRPVVLNMIKPCSGFTPKEGAQLFRQVALGKVDLVKDDELLGSPSYNEVSQRVKAYNIVAEECYNVTGKRTLYIPNITATPKNMRENAQAIIDAGAKACMVNYVFAGADALKEIADEFGDKLFILGHYAGCSVFNSMRGGITDEVMVGFLPRIAGADAVMTMYPNFTKAEQAYNFAKTVQVQKMDMPGIKPLVTTVGGGITAINQQTVQQELGNDMILGIGGAIQGHPMGATQGAIAAMAAVEATSKGIPLNTAAKSCEALQKAIELWG